MPRHPAQWLRTHPGHADALLAAALGLVSLVGLLTIDPADVADSVRDADPLGAVLVVAIWTAAAFRRRWPEPMAWTVAALTIPYWVLDYVDAGASLAVLLLAYTLAAHVDRPRSLVVGLVIGIVLVGVMVTGVIVDDEDLPAIAVVGNSIVFATAWTIGDSVRNRHAYLAEVEARADRAERDREAAAERAVQDERVRIARELHDVVAHSVSVMVVQAGAARRVLDRHPDQAAESLSVIETTGRGALDELRRLLGVLRSEDGEAAVKPQPTADDVASLVAEWREAGLDVDLEVEGARPELSDGVSLTVYRVVQEALTNAMKHAGPAHVDVVVRYGDRVEVEVTDDGRGPCGDAAVPSAGQGHIGMRERVELFGGELQVGRRPGGGYRVRATLPLTPLATA
ncbi:MAG TPA: sensor histidine kinase [Acidimicrobiales bacterium]|nr:sensor histidine kinase [Acidimicrobiales bacterium]